MIAHAWRRSQNVANKPVFVQGDLCAYDFGDQTFGFIYGTYYVTYFQVSALLEKLVPLTRVGGRICLVDGLRESNASRFRILDLARQYVDYARFMRQHGMPFSSLDWFAYRFKRTMLLISKDWKKVERWKQEQRGDKPHQIWTEQI
jgi:hypothetical protein